MTNGPPIARWEVKLASTLALVAPDSRGYARSLLAIACRAARVPCKPSATTAHASLEHAIEVIATLHAMTRSSHSLCVARALRDLAAIVTRATLVARADVPWMRARVAND